MLWGEVLPRSYIKRKEIKEGGKERRRKVGTSANLALHLKRIIFFSRRETFAKYLRPILLHLKFYKSIILILSNAVLKYGNLL